MLYAALIAAGAGIMIAANVALAFEDILAVKQKVFKKKK